MVQMDVPPVMNMNVMQVIDAIVIVLHMNTEVIRILVMILEIIIIIQVPIHLVILHMSIHGQMIGLQLVVGLPQLG